MMEATLPNKEQTKSFSDSYDNFWIWFHRHRRVYEFGDYHSAPAKAYLFEIQKTTVMQFPIREEQNYSHFFFNFIGDKHSGYFRLRFLLNEDRASWSIEAGEGFDSKSQVSLNDVNLGSGERRPIPDGSWIKLSFYPSFDYIFCHDPSKLSMQMRPKGILNVLRASTMLPAAADMPTWVPAGSMMPIDYEPEQADTEKPLAYLVILSDGQPTTTWKVPLFRGENKNIFLDKTKILGVGSTDDNMRWMLEHRDPEGTKPFYVNDQKVGDRPIFLNDGDRLKLQLKQICSVIFISDLSDMNTAEYRAIENGLKEMDELRQTLADVLKYKCILPRIPKIVVPPQYEWLYGVDELVLYIAYDFINARRPFVRAAWYVLRYFRQMTGSRVQFLDMQELADSLPPQHRPPSIARPQSAGQSTSRDSVD